MFKGKINITSEICCDLCNEIVHNHFDCPVCEQKWTSGNFIDLNEEDPCILHCDSCGAEFITTDSPYDADAEWEELKGKS